MNKLELCEVRIPCGQGEIRAVSPVDIKTQDIDVLGQPLIIHPGWGKKPERFSDLMYIAMAAGYTPIGFDTRWAFPDIDGEERSKLTRADQLERRNVHNTEGFGSLETDKVQSYYSQRRIIGLDAGIKYLGIGRHSLVGHSEGARICAVAAETNPEDTDQLVLVNPVGTGNSWHGYRRMIDSNVKEIKAVFTGEIEPLPLIASGFSSIYYALRQPAQIIQEKRIIQATNLWTTIDKLEKTDVSVTILAARNDSLVSFDDTADAAGTRPWLTFIPTEGRHTNVYNSSVHNLITEALVSI